MNSADTQFSEVYLKNGYIALLSSSKPAQEQPGHRGRLSLCLFRCKTEMATRQPSSLEKGLMAGEPQETLFSGRLKSLGPPIWNQRRINFSRGEIGSMY